MKIDRVLAKRYFDYNRIIITLVYGLLFAICAFLRFLLDINVFILFLWVSYSFLIMVIDLHFFLKYVVYFYYYITNVIGVFIIESQSFYLYELGTSTKSNDSFFLITFVHWVMITVLLVCDPFFERKLLKSTCSISLHIGGRSIDKEVIYVLAFLFNIICLYLLAKGVNNPAASVHMDRFMYQHEYIAGLWNTFHRYVIYFIPILVIIAYWNKKKYTIFSMALLFTYFFLVGHKFGIFISGLSFFIPFFIDRYHLFSWNFKNMRKIIQIGLVTITSFILIIFTFLKVTYGTSKSLFLQYVYNRLAQQGQMWWAVYGVERDSNYHFQELFRSMGSFFGINQDVINSYDYGIYKLMRLVTPYNIYNSKIERYSRYAFSTEASLFYYFKVIGLIVCIIIFAIVLAAITNWYWKEIKQQNWFGAIASGFFYTIILSVLLQSDFNVLFSKRSAAILLAYISVQIIKKWYTSGLRHSDNQLLNDTN